MASNIDITISQLPLPTEAQLQLIAQDQGLDLSDASGDHGYTSFRDNGINISFWDRRWGVDNSLAFAVAVSREFPWVRVSHVEEWDNRDADEAGGEGFELVAGEIVAEGQIKWVWESVALTK